MGSMIPFVNSQCRVEWVDLAAKGDTIRGIIERLQVYLLNHTDEENARVPPFIFEGAAVVSSGRAQFPGDAIDDM